MYSTPEEFYFRLHHSRPRFKNDVENVLLFMASEIAGMGPSDKKSFRQKLNAAIKMYPGNASLADKTIDNWRTEISTLFGLIEREGEVRKPGRMALLLADNQDLIEFFRYFLFYFQYPGGHLKSQESLKMVQAGIKFKPARYLIQVLVEGQKQVDNGKFGITKAEATHLIFNDLRVTRYDQSSKETAAKILANRKSGTEYDNDGDVVRYAGDILDYMELGDLVKLRPNYQYYANMANLDVLQAFINNNVYFTAYDNFYGNKNITPANIAETSEEWLKYVNNKIDSSIFEANLLSIIEELEETEEKPDQTEFIKEVLLRIRTRKAAEEGIRTKEIGDIGEAIIIEHEKIRLAKLSRNDLLHLIQKIPEKFAVGYDVSSFEGLDNIRRYIEVKTTISRGKLFTSNFHMTPSEWSAADTLGKTYFVYRLMISGEDVTLFLIQNPVGKYKESLIGMVPRDGADIRYTEKSGVWEELLV